MEDENLVCVDCGLVLSQYFGGSEPTLCDLDVYEPSLYLKILDLAHRLSLEDTSFVNSVLESVKRNPISSNENESIVYYSYEYLIEAKNYIKMSTLCAMCGVHVKKMSRFTPSSSGFTSEDLTAKACKLLNLSFNEEMRLHKRMELKKPSGHAPAAELGGFLFTMFSEKLSLKEICRVLNTNPVSIRRYIKKYL